MKHDLYHDVEIRTRPVLYDLHLHGLAHVELNTFFGLDACLARPCLMRGVTFRSLLEPLCNTTTKLARLTMYRALAVRLLWRRASPHLHDVRCTQDSLFVM